MGSVVAGGLLREGHCVRVLDSLLHGGHSISGLYLDDNFSFVRGDIRCDDAVDEALEDAEAVVHLAAIVGDPACARQPQLAREVNLDAALRVFELSRRRGVQRFIFASTCSNYGKMADSSQYITEDSELRPVSLYAETKVAVERTLMDFQEDDGPSKTILRFATLFGLSPRMRFDLTVNSLTMELLTKGQAEVYGEQFWRPYTHVRDAAQAIITVLHSPVEKVRGQVVNVGDTSQNYTKGQLVELICSQIDNPVQLKQVHKNDDPRDYRVSFEKIQRQFGFEITRTVEDGIREIIDVINQGVFTEFDDPRYRN